MRAPLLCESSVLDPHTSWCIPAEPVSLTQNLARSILTTPKLVYSLLVCAVKGDATPVHMEIAYYPSRLGEANLESAALVLPKPARLQRIIHAICTATNHPRHMHACNESSTPYARLQM